MPDYTECANCGASINLDALDTWADAAREIPVCGDDCAAAYDDKLTDARQTETAGLIPAAPQSQGEQTHGK